MSALPTREVAKPWGREQLPAPFNAARPEKTGEIWFEPPPELDQLLVKYIFTSEALSVQVHPSDAQTEAKGLGRQGKEECWLVLEADPGATLGIGFRQALDAPTMRAAALDGSIEQLLTWHPVSRGDFFYIPANTVHAIGAGISLIEVQQNSDITYRLYDYGRPRELHLDHAVAVARREPYPDDLAQHVSADEERILVDGPQFVLIQTRSDAFADRQRWIIPLRDQVESDGEVAVAGECLLLNPGEALTSAGAQMLIGASA